MNRLRRLWLFAGLVALLTACQTAPSPAASQPATVLPPPAATAAPLTTGTPLAAEHAPTATAQPTAVAAPSGEQPTPTATRLSPEDWRDWPVVPQVSDTARAIYQRGLQMGNNPHAFSKVGDCQNINPFFLTAFDNPNSYVLGDKYAYLQETIDYFKGSFSRESLAVKGGFNVAAVLSPLRSDKSVCNAQESPLACELRVHRPAFAIISMEEWWGGKTAKSYGYYLREIVEYTISQGVVPILATKADNFEGDNSINRMIAEVAYEYDVPLWNFWRAAQPLPNHGLKEDRFHLTYARNHFDDPEAMKCGWPWRNLTALQALDAVRRGVTESP